MLSIRRGIFETNSSSMDRYDDYDYDGPESEVNTNITFKITLEFADFVTRERKETIRDLINGNSRFDDVDFFEDIDDCEEVEDGLYASLDDEENLVVEITYSCIVHGSDWVNYYPATRYSPAEGGYYEDWDLEAFEYDKNTHQYKLDEKTTKYILDTLNGILEDIFNDFADEEDEYAEYVNELIKVIKFEVGDFNVD